MSQNAKSAPTSRTAYEIICDAMLSAGYIGLGETPNGEHIANNMRRLNDMCNFIQARYGLKLWIQVDCGVCLKEGQYKYRLGLEGDVIMAKPRRCIEAYYADMNEVRRPLIMMSRNEWNTLATVTNPGTVTAIFPDKQLMSLDIYVWMSPDRSAATGTLHLVLDQQVPNFAAVTDKMAFPPEWARALIWGLADEISSGQPTAIIQLCKANAAQYLTQLEEWDVEDASTMFAPDQRGQFVGRRFF